VIVQLQRLSDGKRRVTSIAEITGMEGDIIQMQEIYKFVRTGTAPTARSKGHFVATGVRPRFLGELTAQGIKIPGKPISTPRSRCERHAIRSERTAHRFYIFAAVTVVLVAEALYLLFFSARLLPEQYQSPAAADEQSGRPPRRSCSSSARAGSHRHRRLSPADRSAQPPDPAVGTIHRPSEVRAGMSLPGR
jgi:hypothetical protein